MPTKKKEPGASKQGRKTKAPTKTTRKPQEATATAGDKQKRTPETTGHRTTTTTQFRGGVLFFVGKQRRFQISLFSHTYDLNPPLPASDAPPVDLAHRIGGVSLVTEPNERKARRVTRNPHLRRSTQNIKNPSPNKATTRISKA